MSEPVKVVAPTPDTLEAALALLEAERKKVAELELKATNLIQELAVTRAQVSLLSCACS